MYKQFEKILNKFNYSNRSYFSPVIDIALFFGFWVPGRSLKSTVAFGIICIFTHTYFVGILLRLIYEFDINRLMNFIQNVPFYLCVLKISTFTYQHKYWEKIFNALTHIEIESTTEKNASHVTIVEIYKNYCHCFTVIFCVFYICLLVIYNANFWITYLIIPLLEPPEFREPFKCLFCSWVPFDENTVCGRYISGFLQTFFGIFAVLYSMIWDLIIVSIMIFIIGQLKALRMRCVHALNTNNEEEILKNLIKCFKLHILIIRL